MWETIIIGAGLAGSAAGQCLMENGRDNFLVLESASEIGGRIQTVEFCDRLFAAGPGWVHGKNNNPIFELLQELQVPMKETNTIHDDLLFVWNTVENQDVTNDYFESFERLRGLIEELVGQLQNETIDPGKSLKDILEEYSDFYEIMSDIDRTVLFTSFEIYLGAPANEISGLANIQCDEIYDLDEGVVNFRILDPLGVPKLIDYLCEDFMDKIKVNCTVKAIEWDDKSKGVTIIVEDGQHFLCKNVIITVQSDLLTKKSIIFKPELPAEKIASWKHVPSVNYCRIFAKFPSKFWPDKEWLIPVVEDVDPTKELICWQNCAKQNLCSEEDNILICHFTSGSNVEKSRFDVDKETLIDLVAESMEGMFPDTFCKPNDVLFLSFWNTDRYSGSFSKVSPGMTKALMVQLGKSVGPLHFAGESVMIELMGTMQAAFLSGQRAAKNIII